MLYYNITPNDTAYTNIRRIMYSLSDIVICPLCIILLVNEISSVCVCVERE